MKAYSTIIPAMLFSAGMIIYISNIDRTAVNIRHTQNLQDEGQTISGRAAWELQRLADPQTGKVPANIHKLELEYASTLPGFTQNDIHFFGKLQSLNWKSRGPWNVGGRTRAFAIDVSNPSKFLAGSTSGGMWTSLNGGTSWTQNWNIVHQSVTCIAQDTRAGKTSTWYIGTGEGYGQSASGGGGAYYLGNGMYKSTDGGQTWNLLPSTTTGTGTPQIFDNVWDIIWNTATNPSDATNDVVYAATYGAIMKSTNGGTSWSVVKGSASASPFSYFTDVAVSPTGVIYAALSSEGTQKGLYRSTDGNTWTAITPTGFPTTYGRIKIGIAPSDENQVYFWTGTTTGFGTPDTNFQGDIEWNSLWKYNAGNTQWFDLSANLPTTGGPFDKQHIQGGYDMVIKVHPTDTNTVFLGGTNLYRSTDGFKSPNNTTFIGGYEKGATLPLVDSYLNHHSDQHELVFDSSNPAIMYSANDGGIFKTTNNAADTVAWTPLNNGYLTTMFYTVALDHASANDSTIIGGTQDNGTWYVNSNNPNASWTHPRGGDGSYCFIANNKSNYYFSIQNGKMMKATLNAGGTLQTYARIDPIGGKDYLFINPYVLDQNNNNIMYLAGGKNLWRNDALNTIPLAGNWDTISTGWTKFPDTVPTANARITAVAVSKNPANTVYYGTSNKNVYRIDNAHSGTPTAVDITATGTNGFPAGYVSCIAIDPQDAGNVMVSFSNYNVYSIYYSTNADSTAPTWTKVAGNLEQNVGGTGNGPSVRWLSIMPVSDGTVFLAATSTGLYATSSLNGTSTLWAQQGAATIGNSICDMIDFRASDGLVAVGTHSRGIFTTNITSINDVLSVTDLNPDPQMQLSSFPNPFSHSTTIGFLLEKNSNVNLGIYNMNGELIRTLANKEFFPGKHRIELSAEHLSSGIYYCVLRTDKMTETKKIILIK